MNNAEKSEKQGGNGTDIPVAAGAGTGNTRLDMYIAHPSSIDAIRESLADLAAHNAAGRGGVSHLFVIMVGWPRMRRLAREIDTWPCRANATWKQRLEQSIGPDGFFIYPEVEVNAVHEASEKLRRNYDTLVNDLESLRAYYPKTVDRLQAAVKRVRQLECDYSERIYPRVRPEMRERAEREYEQGELLDLETFINGVQGVR